MPPRRKKDKKKVAAKKEKKEKKEKSRLKKVLDQAGLVLTLGWLWRKGRPVKPKGIEDDEKKKKDQDEDEDNVEAKKKKEDKKIRALPPMCRLDVLPLPEGDESPEGGPPPLPLTGVSICRVQRGVPLVEVTTGRGRQNRGIPHLQTRPDVTVKQLREEVRRM